VSNGNHPIEPEELMAYLDGELLPGRATAASEHLEHCRECQTIAANLQTVSRRMMDWQVEACFQRTAEGLNASLEQRGRESVGRRRWPWRTAFRLRPWMLGLAGACVATLFMVWTLRLQPRRQLADMLRTRQLSSALVAPPKHSANEPMIARTARLSLTTTEFDHVRDRVSGILERHKGYIGELNVDSPAGAARILDATLLVPADQLESAMSELKSLGRVESESQSGEEITQQYVDLEARLSNARNTEQRLIDILRRRTGKLADVLAVEKEIGEVRGSIERMVAERKNLANRVAFAALTFKVTEDYKAQMQMVPGSLLTRLRNASVEGYRAMVEGVISALLILVSYGPSLLVWGALLFFPLRLAWRGLRRAVP